MKTSSKLTLLLGAAVVGFSALVTGAQANGYPTKPVRIVIPFPPGGTTDTVFRTLQPYFAKALGGKVVIVNTKGAGGAVGTQMAADAKPDGYTIGTLQTNTMIAQAVGLGKYKDEDYEPTVSIGDMPLTLAVKGDGPYKSIKDYQAALKIVSIHCTISIFIICLKKKVTVF